MKLGETFHLQHVLTLLHKPAVSRAVSSLCRYAGGLFLLPWGTVCSYITSHIMQLLLLLKSRQRLVLVTQPIMEWLKGDLTVYSCVVLAMICSVGAFNHMSRSRVMSSPVLSCHACNCGKFPCEGNVQTLQEEEEEMSVCLHFYLHFRWMESRINRD